MNDKRQQIFNWQQQGLIAKDDIEKALRITQAQPDTQQWYEFIKRSLFLLSMLSVACGIIFFFAYNWNHLSSFNKFAIIQVLMIISTFCYTQTPKYSHIQGAVALFMVLIIGALFALFGQTYQTGKDPWQLFALWTLFATPLAYHARSTMIWLVWLTLLNLSLFLFVDVNQVLFGIIFNDESHMLLFIYSNALALILFEALYHKKRVFNRVTAQTAAVLVMMTGTSLASISIIDDHFNGLYIFTYIMWMMAVYYFYRRQTIDILILASSVISFICLVVALYIKIFDNFLDAGGFLLLSVLIIGLSTAGIKWLKQIIIESQDTGARS